MEQIPTAKDYISKNLTDFWEGGKAQYNGEDVEKTMIEFAKLHVEAALKQASEEAKITYDYSGNTGSEYCDEFVDKDSILNSYPLENIK